MSTTTTAARTAPAKGVADKATTPKAPAKKAAAAKAPAKAAATTPKPTPEKRRYQAQGRGGKINVRSFTQVMTHAVDVADKDARSAAAQAGLIWTFFASEEAAKAWAAKKTAEGYDCLVVAATPV